MPKARVTLVGWSGEGIAFDIEFNSRILCSQQLSEFVNIVRADVPLVWARVHGDAHCPLSNGLTGSFDNAGSVAISGVSQQGDFVQVDAKSNHDWFSLLGVVFAEASGTCTASSSSFRAPMLIKYATMMTT